MSESVPVDPVIALDDLSDHTVNFGVDVFPPVELSKEAVRANSFALELRDRWPYLFEKLTLGSADFRIQTAFEMQGKPLKMEIATFSLTPRGPVFAFPQKITALGGNVDLRGVEPASVFAEALQIFLLTFSVQAIRVGVVRNLVFRTGKTDCTPWLGRAVLQFDDAKLAGAQCAFLYNDGQNNIGIQLSPVQLASLAVGPGAAALVGQPNEFGLAVNLDVNNRDLRPLSNDAIHEILKSEKGVWPNRLIQFLNARTLS